LSDLTVEGLATVSGDFRVKGNGLFEGILSIIDTLTTKNIIVTQLSNFLGNVFFKGNVQFMGHATFNADTAGIALVKQGTNSIDVKFVKAYDYVPIVTTTISLDAENSSSSAEQAIISADYRPAVTNRSVIGFTIIMNKSADQDIPVAWHAILVPVTSTPAASASASQ